MRVLKFQRTAVLFAALGSCTVIACSSSSEGSGDDGGSGGSGGEGGEGGEGGKGGKGGNQGGKGGSGGSGGSGGKATGGTGGGGSAGKSGGTGGGSSAGSGGGGAGGGTAGSGGAGGSASATPPKLTGEGIFFSGQTMEFSKLVMADSSPGYAYGSISRGEGGSSNEKINLKVVEVNDPALPEGTKYALEYSAPANTAPYNNIMGFNFRADASNGGWGRFDAKTPGYIAVSFFMKTAGDIPAAVWGMSLLDASNIPSSYAGKGDCSSPTREQCVGSHGKALVVRNVWQEYFVTLNTIPDAPELTQNAESTMGELLRDKLMRLDFLQFNPNGTPAGLMMTAFRFMTLAQAEERAKRLP